MHDVVPLSPATAGIFRDLTFPSYRSLLGDGLLPDDVIGLGFSVDGQPMGLCLARILPNAEAELLSLFVNNQYRGKGLGTQLLAQLEQALCDRGCNRLQAVYMTETRSSAPVEHLFRKLGWTPPQRRLVFFRWDRRILTEPWFRRSYIRPPYEVVPWSEVRDDELQRVRTRQRLRADIPDYLLPFDEDEPPHGAISVALRFNNELIGWLIGHSISPDTIRYTKLFLDANSGGNGRLAMGLIAEAIRRQARVLGLNSYVICGARTENETAIKLFERLTPASISESRVAWKENLLAIDLCTAKIS